MSLIIRSYRLRVYPNGAQRRLLDRWFGATRWLWNTALEIRSEAYRTCGLSLTGNDLSRWLTQWKRTAGHEWRAEVPAPALTRCLRDQDRAFSRLEVGGYERGKGQPFHGYYFRLLKAQGPHAHGGAKDYIVDGRMTGGFAVLAYPVEYGASGVMSFLVSRRGT